MLTLIELYDTRDAANNTLSLQLLKPDEMIVFIDRQDLDRHPERLMENCLRVLGLRTRVTYQPCDPYEIAAVADQMETILCERGVENCAVDIMGGSEALLLAVGACCQMFPELRIISQRDFQPYWIGGPQKGQGISVPFLLSVQQAIALAGGELLGCGHTDWRALDEDTLTLIPRIFEIYMQHRPEWPAFSHYLQKLCQLQYCAHEASYTGPKTFVHHTAGNRMLTVNMAIASDLSSIGVIRDLRLTGTGCSIVFRNSRMVRYLCDTGSWLELYVYSVLRSRAIFHDVEINPVISWDNDTDTEDTTNEVDLIASDGLKQLFISCKSGIPDNVAVNEIAAIVRRFGTQCARPVLVTASDLQRDAPAVFRRAMDMGVTVIDAGMLGEADLAEAFAKLR